MYLKQGVEKGKMGIFDQNQQRVNRCGGYRRWMIALCIALVEFFIINLKQKRSLQGSWAMKRGM